MNRTPDAPIILLDLNYTLVSNSRTTMRFRPNIHYDVPNETYRQWLVESLEGCITVLITARTDDYHDATLASIWKKTGWEPERAYFKPYDMRFTKAAAWKKQAVYDHVLPEFGRNRSYLALESNADTRAMYAENGIKVLKVPKTPWLKRPSAEPIRAAW